MSQTDPVVRRAYAKINLSLDVTGKREDGYHLVKMIMQTVDIYDTIRITRTEDLGIQLLTNSPLVPSGPDNLIWRAAQLMQQTYDLPGGVMIELKKRIPVAAGMAGGSSDAAAVFCGMRILYGIPASDRQLQELAVKLGADIPYCIAGATQLSEGIGEQLTKLPMAPQCQVIVVKPDINVSTAWVYKTLDGLKDIHHPDVDAMCDSIRKEDFHRMADLCGNVLEQVTGAEYPIIHELEQFLIGHGAAASMMTGSGPAVFALFDNAQKASETFEALKTEKQFTACAKFLTRFVYDIGD